MNKFYKPLFFIITPVLIFLDFYSKYYFENSENFKSKVNIIWDFFYLKLVYNPWIAFWIEIPTILLKFITVVFIMYLTYLYFTEKKSSKLEELSYILIISGAIWNAYWRIWHSEVVDFIWVKYFAVFNLADIYIFLWVCIYIIYYLLWAKFIDQKK